MGLQTPVVLTRTLIDITFSLATAAYADGEVLAATQEVALAVARPGATGMLQSIVLLDKSYQKQALDLVFLKTNVSIGTEGSAVTVTDTAAEEILGIVRVAVADYDDLKNSYSVTKEELTLVIEAAAAATSIYIAAVSRGTGTYAAAGITLKLGILQD